MIFFDRLDGDGDGLLSRLDLHTGASILGWHWHEAPLFAVLDLLTLNSPISRDTFISYLKQMKKDPLGPYGEVLLNAPHFSNTYPSSGARHLKNRYEKAHAPEKIPTPATLEQENDNPTISILEHGAGLKAANEYQRIIHKLEIPLIPIEEAALLIIDPQRSFSKGAWMRSIGPLGEVDVKVISQAFRNCANLLKEQAQNLETMFTRCPFPPDSYHWDEGLSKVIDPAHLYFLKPGNSVLFPPTNGFREWVERCIRCRKKRLVMGGCTLNSCVRVSSIETKKYFENQNLRVIVDLSLSGARVSNYRGSPQHGGLSAVESALHEMKAAGVEIVREVKWL